MVDVGPVSARWRRSALRCTAAARPVGVVWYVRNGEILRVANRSQGWTMAIVDIPIAYNEDIDRVREIVERVAADMDEDPDYDHLLLGQPQFAGVESMSGEAVVIRITAKAAPEKQINVARTIRERMKLAFDRAGIVVPVMVRPMPHVPGSQNPQKMGQSDRHSRTRACLVTGATGYVGGRLVPQLLAEGYRVRVLAQHPERLRDIPWASEVEVVAGDATQPDSLAAAMDGVDVAYYLLHSLQEGPQSRSAERTIAQTFADAAAGSSLRRIVYLGGLAPSIPAAEMSPHMRSRADVGTALAHVRTLRRSSFGPPSSSDRGRRRSRCCATSRSVFPR